MTYNEIIEHVSQDTGLPRSFIDKVYRAYWKAIKEHIGSLPLKEDLTEEEFSKLQTNVNIPSIGKLYVPRDKYWKYKEYYKLKIGDKDAAHNKN